ncbi:hypothetical protein DdX_21913 [Ditylenchus destructor]|uniref:Uncharacterized protein n=1 Tax=Ditylenchus destructor TaxID=166010 RepID=A0AAD4QUV1_9BILA|nr:hypothetical protein DdX_21913 [Ditylenchus destructor]
MDATEGPNDPPLLQTPKIFLSGQLVRVAALTFCGLTCEKSELISRLYIAFSEISDSAAPGGGKIKKDITDRNAPIAEGKLAKTNYARSAARTGNAAVSAIRNECDIGRHSEHLHHRYYAQTGLSSLF